MMFKPELAELVMQGRKTQTRRAMSDKPRSPWSRAGCSLKVGKDYAICPGRGVNSIGRVIVDAVDEVRLGMISSRDAHAEGFESVDAFVAAWKAINGAFDEDEFVWRIEFHLPGRGG